MSLYAVEDVDDAYRATRALLWPFDLRRWAKLAVVVFFVGGVGWSNPVQFGGGTPSPGSPGGPGGPGIPGGLPTIGGPELAIIGVIVAAIALLVFGFMFVGSIMEFVFVRSLQREEVSIRRYCLRYWRQGTRLFAFRLALGLLTVGLIGGLVAIVVGPVLLGFGTFSLAALVVVVPVAIAVAILSGVVTGFTTMFVVPIMLLDGLALIPAWRRFWPVMMAQWKQYLAYAIASLVLQVAGSIAASIATFLAVLVIAIPFGIVGLLGAGLLTVSQVAGWAVIGLVVALFALVVLVLVLLSSVPVQTFLRYYALLVLGDTHDAFDLIPERRQSIRE